MIEPISLIIEALITGAKAVASSSVQDAYKGLKSLIQGKFAGKQKAEMVLAEHEKAPEVWKEPLKSVLLETAADKDEEILQLAQKLMAMANPQQAAIGKYNLQISGGKVQGVVIGDQGQVTLTFSDKSDE
jgi:ABC-type dipeptide/oligopeptide/nickel transport system ATPase component